MRQYIDRKCSMNTSDYYHHCRCLGEAWPWAQGSKNEVSTWHSHAKLLLSSASPTPRSNGRTSSLVPSSFTDISECNSYKNPGRMIG